MNTQSGKAEKLKQKKIIETLFSEGNSFSKFPIRIVYQKTASGTAISTTKVGVSVSKRNFKKAVDRNKIKRLLREGYRKNKYLVNQDIENSYTLMIIYIGKEMPTLDTINTAVHIAMRKLKKI